MTEQLPARWRLIGPAETGGDVWGITDDIVWFPLISASAAEIQIAVSGTVAAALERADSAVQIAALSQWVDDFLRAGGRDGELLTMHRLFKGGEELGESHGAYIGLLGVNPRKGPTHELGDVIKEQLDIATAALGVVEHLTGNQGRSLTILDEHIARVHARAELGSARDEETTDARTQEAAHA